jgi:hypothetical protein
MSKAPRRNTALLPLGLLGVGALLATKSAPSSVPEPVAVRHSEGSIHGFLELHTAAGAFLARGDLLQIPHNGSIESRMIFRFQDSSYFEERMTFTQHDVFDLRTYRLIQTGPAFKEDLDASLDRSNGRYHVVTRAHPDHREKTWDGTLDMPGDTYNGLIITLLKNLPPGDSQVVHMVAFTPKPRMIELALQPQGTQPLQNGTRNETARIYDLKPKLGALVGFFAHLLGKAPPDSHAWIVTDDVPAFVRFEGPLYLGPVWRIDLTSPQWPR